MLRLFLSSRLGESRNLQRNPDHLTHGPARQHRRDAGSCNMPKNFPARSLSSACLHQLGAMNLQGVKVYGKVYGQAFARFANSKGRLSDRAPPFGKVRTNPNPKLYSTQLCLCACSRFLARVRWKLGLVGDQSENAFRDQFRNHRRRHSELVRDITAMLAHARSVATLWQTSSVHLDRQSREQSRAALRQAHLDHGPRACKLRIVEQFIGSPYRRKTDIRGFADPADFRERKSCEHLA